jgi:hypothetical protein
VTAAGMTVEFDLRLAKGMPADRKAMTLSFRDGSAAVLDLAEGGGVAHDRVVRHLLRPDPDLFQTFADAVGGLVAVERTVALATEMPPYEEGAVPDFLALSGDPSEGVDSEPATVGTNVTEAHWAPDSGRSQGGAPNYAI